MVGRRMEQVIILVNVAMYPLKFLPQYQNPESELLPEDTSASGRDGHFAAACLNRLTKNAPATE